VSDASVAEALRSEAQLVVIEAPAGCGKTYQGAEYARERASTSSDRLLILTHTHAACSVFAERTRASTGQVEIRTLDSLITHIAGAYHLGLKLPADVGAWARQTRNGHSELAKRVMVLLAKHRMIATALARRYPTILCDEHQDCSPEQHAICMSLAHRGARLILFFDPLQRIFKAKEQTDVDWKALRGQAHAFEELDTPHRWRGRNEALGQWILGARRSLKDNRPVDLTGTLPNGVELHIVENVAHEVMGYRLTPADRRLIDGVVRKATSLLVLTHHNDTARALCGFFFRSIVLWEGHTRLELERLVEALKAKHGDGPALATALVTFIGAVSKGFSPSAFGNVFEREVQDGCASRRSGKPAKIQSIARFLVDEPNHRGIARVLERLHTLGKSDSDFADTAIDCRREFWDAVKLGDFDDPEIGFSEVAKRRAHAQLRPPPKAISTIHKAKGLECDTVVLMPCDKRTFPDRDDARCLLYVALSRATTRLLIVASRNHQSPLLALPTES
jgi:hypothetical protein